MKWGSLILICFFLAGCGAAPTVPTATQTFLPLLILTETPISTKNPTSTITSTSTLIPSATPESTLTPLPTSDNSVLEIFRLLINNGDCRLPCFWGITPGKTTVGEFHQFVNQFENAEWMSHDDGFYTFYYVPPVRGGDTTFPTIFFDDGNIIRGIGIKMDTAYFSFPLTRLLKEYGMPDSVLVGPDESGHQMFVLYEQQRIVGQYHLFPNDKYLCYQPRAVTGIITWAEGDNWLGYVNNLFGRFTDPTSASSLKPLEQTTEYDMETFYKQFSTRNRDICMKTLE